MPIGQDSATPASKSEDDLVLEELLGRVRAGDQDSARILYRRFHQPLLSILRRMLLRCSIRLRHDLDADDLLQEVWLSMFGQIKDERTVFSEAEFTSYIVTVIQNRFRTHYRSRVMVAKRTLLREEPFDLERHDRPARGFDPTEAAVAEDELRQRLARVPEGERPLMRALRAGKPVHEVASEFGISERTLQRIRQRWQQE